jgi:hypothetical protein
VVISTISCSALLNRNPERSKTLLEDDADEDEEMD